MYGCSSRHQSLEQLRFGVVAAAVMGQLQYVTMNSTTGHERAGGLKSREQVVAPPLSGQQRRPAAMAQVKRYA